MPSLKHIILPSFVADVLRAELRGGRSALDLVAELELGNEAAMYRAIAGLPTTARTHDACVDWWLRRRGWARTDAQRAAIRGLVRAGVDEDQIAKFASAEAS